MKLFSYDKWDILATGLSYCFITEQEQPRRMK